MAATAKYWYDTTYHGLTKMTPFKVVYKRDPPPFLRLIEESSRVEEVNTMIEERNKILDNFKDNLYKA